MPKGHTMQTDAPALVQPADPPATTQPAPPAPPKEPADALATLHTELETTRTTLAAIRRERDVHRALFEAGAHDLDIGAAMIERDAGASPDRPIAELVGDLKKRKPNLFARADSPAPVSARPPTSTMGARPPAQDPKHTAAARAATGDRASLMTYLRLRRQPA
jgi:hypothetical protein